MRPAGVSGDGTIYAINNNAEPSLATLRYKLHDASIEAAEEPFESGGKKFNRGSFLLRNVSRAQLNDAISDLGLQADASLRDAKRQNASRPRRAHRVCPHLAQHASRRLVAHRARQSRHSLRLHQHANRLQDQRPQRQVRRHSVSTRRLLLKPHRHHQRSAERLGQSAPMEEHAGNAEPRRQK